VSLISSLLKLILNHQLRSAFFGGKVNLRWLMRAIVRLGIGPFFLRLLQAVFSQARGLRARYWPEAGTETRCQADVNNEQNRPKALMGLNYFEAGFCV